MPSYSMHIISAMCFLNALRRKFPELVAVIELEFMSAQILPDLSPWKPTDPNTGFVDMRHFRDPSLKESQHSHGLIIIPDIDRAKNYLLGEAKKSGTDIRTLAKLASIYFHLCLDTKFFTEYIYKRFRFTSDKVIDSKTGRIYSHQDFVSKKGIGIYNTYDCLTALYWTEIAPAINMLPNIIPPSGFAQYDDERSTIYWKNDMKKFASAANFSHTAIHVDFYNIHNYLIQFANEMYEEGTILDFLPLGEYT